MDSTFATEINKIYSTAMFILQTSMLTGIDFHFDRHRQVLDVVKASYPDVYF